MSEDVEISVEEHNILFSDKASFTLPFTVPWTQKNINILGNPQILTNSTRELNIPVRITHVRFDKSGIIKYFTANRQDKTLELSVLLSEGAFDSWAKTTKLAALTFDHNIFFWGYSPETYTPGYSNKYKDGRVVPLPEAALTYSIVEESFFDGKSFFSATPEAFDQEICRSEFAKPTFCAGIMTSSREDDVAAKFKIVNIDRTTSLLLYVRSLLTYVFEGYTIYNNIFLRGDLARLIIHSSYIQTDSWALEYDFASLVPDIYVKDLLSALESLVGCRFVVNPVAKTVHIVTFKEKIVEPVDRTIRVSEKDFIISNLVPISVRIEAEVNGEYDAVHDQASEAWLERFPLSVNNLNTYLGQLERDVKGGLPWKTGRQERVVFVRPTQSWYLEKYVSTGDYLWDLERKQLSSRLYPYINDVSNGDENAETVTIKLKGVGTTILAPFTQGNHIFPSYETPTKEMKWPMIVPYYPTAIPEWENNVHDYEEELFGKVDKSKLAFSIVRGYAKRTIVDPFKTKDEYVYNLEDHDQVTVFYTCTASGEVYDDKGNLFVQGADEHTRYYAPTTRPLALRPCGEYGLVETFYREYVRFMETSLNLKVAGNYLELDRANLYGKHRINGYEQFIKVRKRTLTLHSNTLSECELITSIYAEV